MRLVLKVFRSSVTQPLVRRLAHFARSLRVIVIAVRPCRKISAQTHGDRSRRDFRQSSDHYDPGRCQRRPGESGSQCERHGEAVRHSNHYVADRFRRLKMLFRVRRQVHRSIGSHAAESNRRIRIKLLGGATIAADCESCDPPVRGACSSAATRRAARGHPALRARISAHRRHPSFDLNTPGCRGERSAGNTAVMGLLTAFEAPGRWY